MVNNPSELIGQEKFKKTIEALKEKYDYVIIDSSPILMVTDSILISRVVDATILIAIYNKTRIDDLKSAIRRINHVGGNVAGVVVNRTKIILNQYNTKYFYGNTIEVNNKSLRMKLKRFFYNRKIKKTNKDIEKKQIKEEKIKSIDKNQKMINKINMKNQELEKELIKLKEELANQVKINNKIEETKIENNPKASKEPINNLANKTQTNKIKVDYVKVNNEKNKEQINTTKDNAKTNESKINNIDSNKEINNTPVSNTKTMNTKEIVKTQEIEQIKNTQIENNSNNNVKVNNNNINNNNSKINNPKINNDPKVLNKYMANILKDINNA